MRIKSPKSPCGCTICAHVELKEFHISGNNPQPLSRKPGIVLREARFSGNCFDFDGVEHSAAYPYPTAYKAKLSNSKRSFKLIIAGFDFHPVLPRRALEVLAGIAC